jgi:hypothetical protein
VKKCGLPTIDLTRKLQCEANSKKWVIKCAVHSKGGCGNYMHEVLENKLDLA